MAKGTHSDQQKQETRTTFEEDETAERLLETSTSRTRVEDGKGKEDVDVSSPMTEGTTETVEEEEEEEAAAKIDINKNLTVGEDGALEQTDGSSTSRQTVEEHRDDVDKDEELPALEDNANEIPLSPSGLPLGQVPPIPAEALLLKDEAMALYKAGDYTQALERYSSAMDAMEIGEIYG